MPAAQHAQPTHIVGLIPVITFVLWTGCLAVGGLGYVLHYAHPQSLISTTRVVAKKITVELDDSPPLVATGPTHPSEKLTAPPPAPRIAVAEPSAALAFPLPVSGLVNISDADQASASGRIDTAEKNTAIQPLVFGQDAGRQPAPPYPSAAIRQGQEGIVTVRLNVGEDGRVTTAETSIASSWPLLNEAAIRTVRERWRFGPGAIRTYEVAIRFTLQK